MKNVTAHRRVPKQTPLVKLPSEQDEGVHVKPGSGSFVHSIPDGNAAVQLPMLAALSRVADASQGAGKVGGKAE